MCGICGMIGWEDDSAFERMLRRLIHRGPDEEGRYAEPGLRLGARRLRVIDPEGGSQPVTNEDGTVRVILNGEIYNFRELRDELIRKGHRLVSRCDTEVLAHLYEEEGEGVASRLRGMFAFALWDRRRGTLLLARDRFGIKPLYYTEGPGTGQGKRTLTFASELPSLLAALPGWSIRRTALAEYLRFLYIPSPGTVIDGVRQVRPGELLIVSREGIRTRQFATLHPSQPVAAIQDPHMAGERFREVLRDSVRAHLVSDVPLGLFLSGGLDSGALLAMMRATTNGRIRTFSIGYADPADRSFNELEAARLMADRFGAEHTEERLTPDAAKLLLAIAGAMGEPFADASVIPTYLVSGLARRSVTVALSGIGGDELFGGYPRYLGMRLAPFYAHVPRTLRRWIARRVAPHLTSGDGSQDHIGRLKRFLESGDHSIADQYLRWITFLPEEWGPRALAPDLRELTEGEAWEECHKTAFQTWPGTQPAELAVGLDLQTYLPDDLLRMADRLSMAHSLELRVPFCDPEVLAFALAMPASMRFAGLRLKGFVRRALGDLLPSEILARPKYGFMVPLARWLRIDLKEMVHDLLAADAVRRRGYLNPEYVSWLIREHESRRRNLADQLFAVLMLELWSRQMEPV